MSAVITGIGTSFGAGNEHTLLPEARRVRVYLQVDGSEGTPAAGTVRWTEPDPAGGSDIVSYDEVVASGTGPRYSERFFPHGTRSLLADNDSRASVNAKAGSGTIQMVVLEP